MYYELDPQGRFAERYWDDGRGECVNGYPILQNDCDVYRKCGAFGVCDSTKRPICSCLKGFQPKSVEEWCRGNWNSGCVRTTHLQCQRDDNNGSEAGQNDGFLKMKMMKVPAFPDRSSIIYGGCGDRCMKNCSCVAYAYDAGIGCMFWGGDLTDLQKFPFRGVDLYIRLPSSEFGKLEGDKRKQQFEVNLQQQQLPLFKFEELSAATDNFHHTKKLGQGGFGPVYRGRLDDGKEIAVKRLSKASGARIGRINERSGGDF
ncbi:hypothetical protein V6N11_004073 [Hibiscus sabdariffa]|uniref:Uncharacterized protein n=1 Tax=Hibiscus sabdariffa TaxID=183260 RepID=A0ABR2SF56_9ROSI